jgi:hypothetical protein
MVSSAIDTGFNMKPGDLLYAAADQAKLTNNSTNDSVGDAATDKANGAYVANTVTAIGMVVKGASVAKCQANFNNTTLYPIRIKLLV